MVLNRYVSRVFVKEQAPTSTSLRRLGFRASVPGTPAQVWLFLFDAVWQCTHLGKLFATGDASNVLACDIPLAYVLLMFHPSS